MNDAKSSACKDEVATAKGLWDKLESTFKAKYNARRLLLRQQLNTPRKEATEAFLSMLLALRALLVS